MQGASLPKDRVQVPPAERPVMQAWAEHLADDPDRVVLRWRGRSLTRAQLDAAARRFAQAHAVESGQRIALQLQNTPVLVCAVLGTWLAGGVVVCVNPMYRERELAHVIEDSDAALLVTEATSLAVAESAVPDHCRLVSSDEINAAPIVGDVPSNVAPRLEDPALITYTSGTTGPAKGAVATHANVAYGAEVYREAVGVDGHSVVLAMAPLTHVTGMIGHLAVTVSTGCRLVVDGRFDAQRMLDLMTSESVTVTIAALTAYKALLALPDTGPPPALQALYSGGAPVAPSVAREVRSRFGVPLGNAYGLTETTSISHLTPPDGDVPVDQASGALSIGFPAPGSRAWIERPDGSVCDPGEPGELVVCGPGVVSGYWNRPEATAEAMPDGALRTGDVAVCDSEGWFYIVDRMKDQINASGFKVWPREVEEVLMEHPKVHEVAVVGVPDPYRGETVKAVVSCVTGVELEATEIQSFARERLAGYKVPRLIEFVDELPKTFSGKILRRAFRDQGDERRDDVR